MVRQRTTPILVIAILHLVGVGIGLFGSCYSIVIVGGCAGTGADDLPSEDYPEDDPWREPPRSDRIRR